LFVCLFAAYLQYSLCRSDSIQRRAVASASSGFKGDVASLALTERAELENFATCIKNKQPLVTPSGDAVRNAAVLEAIIRSSTTHATVQLG
jgi:predicted dehydrogenase